VSLGVHEYARVPGVALGALSLCTDCAYPYAVQQSADRALRPRDVAV